MNDLHVTSEDDPPCIIEEFIVRNRDISLQCAAWIHNTSSKLYVLYLHTNTRALVDAKEVLPFCHKLGANLVAFDLPGCGKSGGNLSFAMVNDLSIVLNELTSRYECSEVILWARGMSTAIAIEYCSELAPSSPIKFIVLDSPFLSVKQMVKDATRSVTAYGMPVPQRALLFCATVVRKTLQSRLGSDPYTVVPMDFVPGLNIPGHILSAIEDDYMPPHHGRAIAGAWARESGEIAVDCSYSSYPGRHFGERGEAVVTMPVEGARRAVRYRPPSIQETLHNSIGLSLRSFRSSPALKGMC
eukprot:CAMPEP_0185036544 /NCGR_PEP_ID=MMETSP1103-20130426/29657_1 /TAXON_ID=36769 /ORGANISM="Paraphysomonas bandaiensis, Strain Caron Lab Isolate" /LENGTH=299 /DNA_ID=CAMNT_0027574111 /DNA_START=220 /DNA_END=1119 /DNA_ORIENTATION=-